MHPPEFYIGQQVVCVMPYGNKLKVNSIYTITSRIYCCRKHGYRYDVSGVHPDEGQCDGCDRMLGADTGGTWKALFFAPVQDNTNELSETTVEQLLEPQTVKHVK